MLLGQFQEHLDGDRHLTLPLPFRADLAEGMYITQGFEKNLLILTEGAFRQLYQKVVAMNLANPLARLLLRLMLSNASRLEMDENGCVQIPENLATFASLNGKVVLIGQGDYLEVWAPTMWEKQANDLQNAEANAGRFAVLDLAMH